MNLLVKVLLISLEYFRNCSIMLKEICRDEVALHCTPDDAWMIIRNDVINITNFLEEHPGGMEILIEFAGCDATDAFESVGHSTTARMKAEKYKIGVLPIHEQTSHGSEYVSHAKKLVCPMHIAA